MKLIFCMQIYKPFCKLVLSILVSMASLAQSTRNNKFAKSLLYLEKEVRDKVDFCRDKLQSIQKVSTVMSDGCSQVLKIKLEMQLIFCMEGNIKVFNKLIISFLTGVVSLPKIPKITSLQYLTNDMLDYLDCRYVHRPPNHESNQLHKCQSKTIANNNFYLKKKRK